MANLLVICGYWPTRANPISGIFFAEQACALSQLGHSVTVLVPKGFWKRSEILSLQELGLPPETVNIASFRAPRFPGALSGLPGAFWVNNLSIGRSIAREIYALAQKSNKFDGCIAHGLRHISFSAPVWAPVLNAPVLCMVHGVDPILHRQGARVKTASLKAEAAIHGVGVVGKFLIDHVEKLGFNCARVKTLSNGTELPIADMLSAPLDRIENRKRVIVSVANLIDVKGINDALEALAMVSTNGMRNWEYRIVGDGPERNRLQALAKRLGIDNKIVFLGRLLRSETLREIDRCDLFCLPSWGEAFGIVYLEAMARARPVIGCTNCGPADFVTSGKDGILVPPHSPAELAASISLLWQDPQKLRDIALAGRETALHYSWRRNAQQVLDCLEIAQ